MCWDRGPGQVPFEISIVLKATDSPLPLQGLEGKAGLPHRGHKAGWSCALLPRQAPGGSTLTSSP